MATPSDSRPRRSEDRPSVREYAVGLAMIALLAVVAFILFGQQTEAILSTVSHSV